MDARQSFLAAGWCRFAHDPALAAWIGDALPAARAAVAAPENRRWLRHQATWFAGVNALDNDPTGAVAGGHALSGAAVDFVRTALGLPDFAWDRGQVSVCYPGYPQPSGEESAAAFGYRLNRDAAHVDGLVAERPSRRRHPGELHAFILGITMTQSSPKASPLVVWEGSHELMRKALRAALAGCEPDRWGEVDVTEIYQAARREVFATCRRVSVHARPGEAYLLHRLVLHGISPWGPEASAGPDGRMIVYFRPSFDQPRRWLDDP